MVKASKINDCCPIKTQCTVFRTRYKLEDLWEDEYGPVITRVTSIDGSTEFTILSAKEYQTKKDNPYIKWVREKFAFYSDGFIWWENEAPKKVNVNGFFENDISTKYHCDNVQEDCIPFLDQKFLVPGWIEAELISKAVEQILGQTKRMPTDVNIDKNENRT